MLLGAAAACAAVLLAAGLLIAEAVSEHRGAAQQSTSEPPLAGNDTPAGNDSAGETVAPAIEHVVNFSTGAASTSATATSPPPPTTPSRTQTTTTTASTAVASKCYHFWADLGVTPQQRYATSPDNQAKGYAEFRLCTNGTMHSTSTLYGGKSELIASHIHRATGEDGNPSAGEPGEGPPVVNFCGRNATGLIDDGTPYTQECQQWDSRGAARNQDVPGVFVARFKSGLTDASRVEDVARRPEMYYANFHTIASWSHWSPVPHGICRGKLQLIRDADAS